MQSGVGFTFLASAPRVIISPASHPPAALLPLFLFAFVAIHLEKYIMTVVSGGFQDGEGRVHVGLLGRMFLPSVSVAWPILCSQFNE